MIYALTLALAATPTHIDVSYTVVFDVGPLGDSMCPQTEICDCTTTFEGSGDKVTEGPERVTFKGRWKATATTCGDAFSLWVPVDGVAFHTIHLKNGQAVDWVVHQDLSGHSKLSSGQKAAGQYWVDDLKTSWPGAVVNHQQDQGDMGGFFPLTTTHDLKIVPVQ